MGRALCRCVVGLTSWLAFGCSSSEDAPSPGDVSGLQGPIGTGGTAPVAGAPLQPAASGTGGTDQTPLQLTGGAMPMAGATPMEAGASGAAGAEAGTQDTGGTGGAPMTTVPCATDAEELFSFFMVSYEAIRRESGSDDGFGGDLGGIGGADAICTRVAMTSSECAGNKQWRAFLSTTTEDAIDRIGPGPWHDRLGRLLANNVGELLNDRPPSADPEIINDFPNEFGVPNHNPDGTGEVDNHQTLTGSGLDGRLYTQQANAGAGGTGGVGGFGGAGGFGGGPGGFAGGSTACMDGEWTPEKATCWDWTVSDPVGCPRVGHSWPRQGSGINWISVWNEGGCAPGAVLDDFTAPGGPTVGSFGGYGGFYCFAAGE